MTGPGELQELKAGIDVGALEEDVEAALCLQDLGKQLVQKESALSRCVCTAKTVCALQPL